jgi:hypothetical protein
MAQKKSRFGLLFALPFIAAIPIVIWGALETEIKKLIGKQWWEGLMPVFIVLVVLCSLLPFIGVFKGLLGMKGGFNFFWGSGKKAKEILSTGKSATATLVALGESSQGGTVTINDQPYLNLKLQIDDGYKQPYEVSLDTVIPRSAVPQFQPGASFKVKIDPADPNTVVFDAQGTESYVNSGAVQSVQQPTVGGKNWTQLDRTLLERDGKDGVAKVLSIEDTGRSEDFNPLVRVSYEVFIPREEPYTVTKDIPMPTQYVQQLRQVVGKSFPCRVHPQDPQKIQVNITF